MAADHQHLHGRQCTEAAAEREGDLGRSPVSGPLRVGCRAPA
jgi:hypothetical protein